MAEAALEVAETGEVSSQTPSATQAPVKREPFAKSPGGSKPGRVQASQMLRDMRAVYKSDDEAEDKTPGLKFCRKLKKDNPKEFMSRLQAMERERRAANEKLYTADTAAVAVADTPKLAEDVGAERMGELTRRLLAEFKSGGK